MALEIVQYGNPILEKPADPVTSFGQDFRPVLDELLKTLKAHPEGAAVAAPQIGFSQRAFVWKNDKGTHVVVNPRIVEFSRDQWMYKEGCLSVRDHFWYISRPKTVHVEFVDEHGAPQVQQYSEFEGRVFQHELDHLDGILLLSKLTKSERKTALRQLVR